MAFFLEAAFLGVLLFGRKLVPRWAHFVAALMVALGTLFSAFWILSANSWMQTPQGYTIVDGRFFAVDWLAVVFNPSFPYRFAPMVCASYITTGFVVLSVGAWLMRKGQFAEEGRLMFSITLWLLRTSSSISCMSHVSKMPRPIFSRAASTKSVIALPFGPGGP